jgi:hypothetical protein
MVTRFLIVLIVTVALQVGVAHAGLWLDPDGLIRIETATKADSVTVGERFHVLISLEFPDSLVMIPLLRAETGTCRLLSLDWKESESEGTKQRVADLMLLSLDLNEAILPSITFDFETPSADTLRVFSDEVVLPVRHLALESDDVLPLKAQWEAPQNYLARALWAAGILLALILLWWLLVGRKRKKTTEAQEVKLPADYVALSELTRIEKLGLVREHEYKRYYTLVVDVVRGYLEDRFAIEALDRTSEELMAELMSESITIDELDQLLGDADLVKFAKFAPTEEAAAASIHRARKIVIETTNKYRPEPVGAVDQPLDGPDLDDARKDQKTGEA